MIFQGFSRFRKTQKQQFTTDLPQHTKIFSDKRHCCESGGVLFYARNRTLNKAPSIFEVFFKARYAIALRAEHGLLNVLSSDYYQATAAIQKALPPGGAGFALARRLREFPPSWRGAFGCVPCGGTVYLQWKPLFRPRRLAVQEAAAPTNKVFLTLRPAPARSMQRIPT